MSKAPSNTDIARIVDEGFEEVKKDIKDMKSDISTLTNWMNFEKGRQSVVRNKNGGINWFELGKQLLVFLTVAASIILVIVQVFAERMK